MKIKKQSHEREGKNNYQGIDCREYLSIILNCFTSVVIC
jgi:hypothetical protein